MRSGTGSYPANAAAAAQGDMANAAAYGANASRIGGYLQAFMASPTDYTLPSPYGPSVDLTFTSVEDGSTLGLDYALRYPQRCLGLILRGIFLSTVAEFEAIYARKSFAGNERRLAEFDTFLEPAAALAQQAAAS